jgi:hypothetical protein
MSENYQITNKKRCGKEPKNAQSKQNTINKMTGRSSYLSIITLNVNGLNSPMKRDRLAEWIKL